MFMHVRVCLTQLHSQSGDNWCVLHSVPVVATARAVPNPHRRCRQFWAEKPFTPSRVLEKHSKLISSSFPPKREGSSEEDDVGAGARSCCLTTMSEDVSRRCTIGTCSRNIQPFADIKGGGGSDELFSLVVLLKWKRGEIVVIYLSLSVFFLLVFTLLIF